MLAIVQSVALYGLEGRPVQVEVDVSPGLPGWEIVGLPDPSVREAKDRVRTAIRNSGLDFPLKRITVNLAPADLKKEGPSFDLPIALGVLAASEQIPLTGLEGKVFLGELSLEGNLRGVSGVLPMALSVRKQSSSVLAVPAENGPEAALVEGLKVLPLASLQKAVELARGELEAVPLQAEAATLCFHEQGDGPDLAEVRGQKLAKRALEIAAAGGHNLLLVGSPGSGKTMLARRLPTILPALNWEEALQVTSIHSAAGMLPREKPLLTSRPFRSPHHTSSASALVGGGRMPRPGEVSLASHGVLFLDEFPEFERAVLEALRQPLEDRVVTISRVAAALTYPAEFLLVASMNPCPCGYLGDQAHACTCTPPAIEKYWRKISGPLLDRIDLQVEVPRLEYREVEDEGQEEASGQVRQRVEKARLRQGKRLAGEGLTYNAQMQSRHVRRYCALDRESRALMRQAFGRLGLSMRAHDRALKVARTIADLEGAESIAPRHLAEALQYRTLDKAVTINP